MPNEESKAYLADDITVGQLMRWINAEAVRAGRNMDEDHLRAVVAIGERVEAAHAMFVLANTQGDTRPPTT